jgi:hypothetical protein
MRPALTITIRRRTSGHKLAAFACDNYEHAHAVACLIAGAPEYAGCFVVGTGWDGSELFTVGLQPAAPVAVPHAPPPPAFGYAPALPQPSAYAQPYPRPVAYTGALDAELVEDFPPPPALPPRRW